MAEQYRPSYWHQIPDVILRDKRISSSGVRLYLEISGLLDKRGYCWASNEYLAELMGVTGSTVSRLVKQLEDLGYIRTTMAVNDDRTGSCRRIYAGISRVMGAQENAGLGSTQKCADPPSGSTQKCADRSTQKCVPNNTSKIQDNTPLNPPKKPKRPKASAEPDWLPERFEGFWQFYPHDYRGNKQKARRAWNKLKPDEETIRAIACALQRWMKSERWREGIGIPNASTYINPDNGYWEPADAHKPREPAPPVGRYETVVESRYEKL